VQYDDLLTIIAENEKYRKALEDADEVIGLIDGTLKVMCIIDEALEEE